MKKIFTFLFAIFACTYSLLAWDYENVQIGNVYYNLNAETQTAEVTYNPAQYFGNITIPSSIYYNNNFYEVTSIGDSAFFYCTDLEDVWFNIGVTKIGNYAFYNCSALTRIIIPNGVTIIGEYAFYNCSNIFTITIPNSVSSIGDYTFQDCRGLTSVTIPNSVTSIGDYAFSGCRSLTAIDIATDNPNYCSDEGVCFNKDKNTIVIYPEGKQGAYAIPNSVTSIGDYTFQNCRGLASVTIPNSVTSIGDYAFYGCSGLISINVYADHPNYSSIDGILLNKDKTTLLEYPKGKQGTYTIPNSVTSIGYAAFYGCTGLTSVTIGNSVTSIGDWAFRGCSGLTSVMIGNSVTSIGDYAFQSCSGLTSATIPNSVISIGEYAFQGCSGLTSVMIGNSVTSIGSRAFNDCSSLTFIEIPNSVTSIGSSAFSDCSSLTSIEIPNSVTSIGDWAFRGCSGLTSPLYNAHLFAFMPTSCSGAYNIPDGIESIVIGAFSGCSGLTSVTIPNSVTSIGIYAFEGCSGLTSVTIGNSVTSIGSSAFSGCSGLKSVIWNAKNCDGYDFGNQVESFAFGEEVEVIPSSICREMNKLKEITITQSVTSIGSYAFDGCSGLTSVTIGNSVTSIGWHAFSDCSGLTSVTIPSSVTSIESWSFSGCTNLTSVTIPNSVTSIGSGAFYGCGSLKSMTIESVIPPTLGDIALEETNSCPIYIPCGTLDAYKLAWSTYTSRIKYSPLDYSISRKVNIDGAGIVQLPRNKCDDDIVAIPYYGYHFAQWSDSVTDNPRSIVLTQDTTFIAEFAKNEYKIITKSSNAEWGTTEGDKVALYLDDVEISAIPKYGYHFVNWDDDNTSNPRIVTVTDDKSYTAYFARNTYSITKNAEHGSILGNNAAEYLDEVTLSVTSDYSYHFLQWSDGNTDNPRTFVVTQDTTFTAEFEVDRTGTCGTDLALTWTYDPEEKHLTISGSGAFNDNMQCGIEARAELTKLVFENGVTSIGTDAFKNCTTLTELVIGKDVKKINDNAFYNCENLVTIYNYRPTPTNALSTAFDGVDKFECALYVPASSVDMYKNAAVWRDFYYIYAIPETPTSVEEVQSNGNGEWRKVLRDGQIFILHGEKTYTLTGQAVR